jgi:hypothetical protein
MMLQGHHSQPGHLARAPARVRGAKLENIALVPASLLPYKAVWQTVANELPQGAILVCLPPTHTATTSVLTRAITALRAHGYRVTIVPAERFTSQLGT